MNCNVARRGRLVYARALVTRYAVCEVRCQAGSGFDLGSDLGQDLRTRVGLARSALVKDAFSHSVFTAGRQTASRRFAAVELKARRRYASAMETNPKMSGAPLATRPVHDQDRPSDDAHAADLPPSHHGPAPSDLDDRRLRVGPLVGVVMGSTSDWPTMHEAASVLDRFGVSYEARVVSAHRTPDAMFDYASSAEDRGLRVIIAGAGGAAHLPGMLAAKTTLPILGVPIESRVLKGQDSLLSIVQMPAGIPVATFAIGRAGATNAALFAVAMLAAAGDRRLAAALEAFRADQTATVAAATLPPVMTPETLNAVAGAAHETGGARTAEDGVHGAAAAELGRAGR